ncbi:ribosome assembly RNA-binding protein YhbY [Kaarinaea lacus]
MQTLNAKQKRFLRGKAHSFKPVVTVGSAGLTESVIAEFEQSIEHHELIKVKINAADRQERKTIIEKMSATTNSHLIFSIGHTAIFYRPAKQPSINLPH